MPRRGYPYRRFSDGKQKTGDSLRRQGDWAKQVCEQEGWFYDDTYAFDDKGRSGFHKKNLSPTAGLTRFLEYVKRRRIEPGSVLLIENIDRLSRADVDTAHDLFREIIRAGIWICTKTPFRIYRGDKESSFLDLLEPIWIMYVAWMESAKKSDRAAGAWEAARARARAERRPHQALPPWWVRKAAAGGYELHPQRAPLMRRICGWATDGMGFGSIVARLEREGTRAESRSGHWTPSFLREAMRGRGLLGEYQPHEKQEGRRRAVGSPIPGYYPALLTEEEWSELQRAIVGRRHRRCGRPPKREPNLFTGLVYDAVSRRPMSLRLTGHAEGNGPRYRRLSVSGGGRRVSRVTYGAFEDAVLQTVAMLRPEDVLESDGSRGERRDRIVGLTRKEVALAHRVEVLTREAADLDVEPGPVLAALREVAAERKRVAGELAALKLEERSGRAEALAEAQTLTQMRQGTAGEERAELDRRIKAALPAVVESVWVQNQWVSDRVRIDHVQIFLRSGGVRNVQLLPPRARAALRAWQLEADGHDLRRGPFVPRQVGHRAAAAEPA